MLAVLRRAVPGLLELAGAALFVTGVALAAGVPAALLVAGVLLALAGLALSPPAPGRRGR